MKVRKKASVILTAIRAHSPGKMNTDWGEQEYAAGDWILYPPSDPVAEVKPWPVSDDYFKKNYEQVK
jgi:hypothetical protein